MISKMATFDPSAPSTVPIVNTLQGEQGFLLVWNESMISITINYFNYSRLCPAGTFTVIALDQAVPQFTWSQALVFPNVGQAPASLVYIEGATIDEADYIGRMTYPMPLPRLSNIGNQVSTTGTNSVINDGQPVGTQVVEGTPTGASGSQLLLLNDGTGKLGKGNLLMNATQLSAQNGYTFDTTKLSTAALPAGVTIGAAQLTSGALPAGVTLPGSQVTGDVAANQIGPGALDTDVTIVASQVASGDLANATIPAANLDAGALPAGVTLGAAQVTAGFLPTTVEVGTSTTAKLSMQDLDGFTGAVGIITQGSNIWFESDKNQGFLYNARYDGTNYRFITGNGDYAIQILISKDAQAGTLARWNARYSSAPGNVTGAIITWGSWFCFAQMLGTSGIPTHIFSGTNTPSGQNTDDLWFDG